MRGLIVVTALSLSASLYAAGKSYELTLTLSDQARYAGQEIVAFDLESKRPTILNLKFEGGHITSAKINSEPAQVKTNAVGAELSGAALKAGPNTVEIVFEHPYVTDGSGLHAWKDSKDGRTYIYSRLRSHRPDSVFPVFEKSNDASLELVVNAPKDWAVSSDDQSLNAFSLYAGPFKVSEFKSAAGTPVRLLVPQSMAEIIPAKEWFTTAQMAMAYYPWYLKTPYPFKKYDQAIIAPLGRTPEEVARAIFKDVAAKWFGKFVAIDDSSLLTLMAYQGVKEATPFVGTWENFYLNEKQGAYSKAAALREIFFAVGPQPVQEGLAQFFTDFAHKSANLDDVLNSLEKADHQSLRSLRKEWLSTPGLNTVTPQYECVNGKIENFSIAQSEPLRSHVGEVALYKDFEVIQTTKVSYALAKTALKQLKDLPCPDAVDLNVEDHDYIREAFEPNTLAAFQSGIGNFVDPFFRLKGWMALREQVEAQRLPQNSYVDIAVKELAHEKDPVVAQYVLGTLCRKGGEVSCLRAKKAFPPPPKSEHH